MFAVDVVFYRLKMKFKGDIEGKVSSWGLKFRLRLQFEAEV